MSPKILHYMHLSLILQEWSLQSVLVYSCSWLGGKLLL